MNDITYEQAIKWFKLKPDYSHNELENVYKDIITKGLLDTETATIAYTILSENLRARTSYYNQANAYAQANAREAREQARNYRRQNGTSRAEYLTSNMMNDKEFLETPANDDDPAGYRVLRGIAQHFPYRIAFILIGLALWSNPWDLGNIVLPIAWINMIFPIITDAIRETLIKATYMTLDIFEEIDAATASKANNTKNIKKHEE